MQEKVNAEPEKVFSKGKPVYRDIFLVPLCSLFKHQIWHLDAYYAALRVVVVNRNTFVFIETIERDTQKKLINGRKAKAEKAYNDGKPQKSCAGRGWRMPCPKSEQ